MILNVICIQQIIVYFIITQSTKICNGQSSPSFNIRIVVLGPSSRYHNLAAIDTNIHD